MVLLDTHDGVTFPGELTSEEGTDLPPAAYHDINRPHPFIRIQLAGDSLPPSVTHRTTGLPRTLLRSEVALIL